LKSGLHRPEFGGRWADSCQVTSLSPVGTPRPSCGSLAWNLGLLPLYAPECRVTSHKGCYDEYRGTTIATVPRLTCGEFFSLLWMFSRISRTRSSGSGCARITSNEWANGCGRQDANSNEELHEDCDLLVPGGTNVFSRRCCPRR
jgi:hypothetical protein